MVLPKTPTIREWASALDVLLPQHLNHDGVPDGSAADSSDGEWKILGLTMRPHQALEKAYFVKHGVHLIICGVRPLVPTLSESRLCSLLTTSRALKSEEVTSTLHQRAAIFLLLGGWINPRLRKVGINLIYTSSSGIGARSDILSAIETEALMLSCESDEARAAEYQVKERRIRHLALSPPFAALFQGWWLPFCLSGSHLVDPRALVIFICITFLFCQALESQLLNPGGVRCR